MDLSTIAALAQSVDAGSGLAQLLALCWLVWKTDHLEKTVTKHAEMSQRTARRVSHIFGHLGLDDAGE